ncbi:universal stress protein [Halorarius litoreus]|uniref:universal stress protein n=1 Tax=Halorarius litoreus TaxID=2962676 RepID=UPI0020CEA788|nr:universal stress protein [Halorarius litoreus]
MYDRILVPIDGTPGSERAVRNALDIASKYDATVYVVSVVDNGPLGRDGARADRVERAEKALEKARREAEDAGVDLQAELLEGKVTAQIMQYVDKHGIDLVVMGTHGRKGFDRFVVGSVSEQVVRNADVPVLTVSLGSDTVKVTSVEQAHEIARDALAARGYDDITLEQGAYDEPSAYVVQGVADGTRCNVHVEKGTGSPHVVELGSA